MRRKESAVAKDSSFGAVRKTGPEWSYSDGAEYLIGILTVFCMRLGHRGMVVA